MSGISKFFSPHLGTELWIYGDGTLIRIFSHGGKMGLIKRERTDSFFLVQLFTWPLYLCFPPASFEFCFYFYWYVLETILWNIGTEHLNLCSFLCTVV